MQVVYHYTTFKSLLMSLSLRHILSQVLNRTEKKSLVENLKKNKEVHIFIIAFMVHHIKILIHFCSFPAVAHWCMGQDSHRLQNNENISAAHYWHRSYGRWCTWSGIWHWSWPSLLLVKKKSGLEIVCVVCVFFLAVISLKIFSMH